MSRGKFQEPERKARIVIGVVLFAFLIIVFMLCRLLVPRPVADGSELSIIYVKYNPCFNQGDSFEQVVIEGHDEEILACLRQYQEHRTVSRAVGYSWNDVQISILLHTESGSKEILLGNVHYSYDSYGKAKYEILNADQLRSELLQIIKGDDLNEKSD